ncbi:beta-ketoacyl-ACP synthase III [Marinobacter lutaoensis]|jgi:3-oxoacyl-[acyl-carrier-protein] synthase-3|uniref:Beta-ketoacyl-[acyl-carrier-protein] synthase III n=1 Tax=Marinobacter lutaoensis TaxID=135739 RepID=A0A1V2DUG0_9GAMM|nr:beta-ketoacyl-ACP synthase III [Marinobacter lutaoensis]MBE02119.1 ketoacyl-ACP synthase III [Marinobacter sp.]MBI42439.1 ketoacyl-ACP synthase III [Oceanospirillales bacterium]NVD35510.1 ketoacyl-ACP synthase III [Marinobacter lutaoensis]ONF44090.1 3-oxoacyl-ACP synthase [Marinobacter lutaoensis]|tara:strand:- start:4162 stop:5130 length:969 start_codon:yes stop_codon:yes gene_type:complete
MTYARIVGTGSYLPEKVLTNKDLESMVDTTDQWIRERTGIAQRHIAADGQTTVDLAERAAWRALEAAGITPGDIDLIVFATTTPDKVFPSCACILQARLGIHGCPAFDVQAVCSGFVYALSVADKFIRTGSSRRALVIGAEVFSRIINWQDRGTCVLFGDGAGAVVLEASEETGILSTHLHADGQYEELLHVPCGIADGFDRVKAGEAFVEMKGNEVFKVAVNTLGKIVDETLAANGMQKSDVDWLVPHQANLRIISATAKKLRLPMDRVVVTVDRHGNTSAASIPLALDAAVRDGRIQRNEVLLLEAFGGGFTWGSALLRY